jgi:hypothetical protein
MYTEPFKRDRYVVAGVYKCFEWGKIGWIQRFSCSTMNPARGLKGNLKQEANGPLKVSILCLKFLLCKSDPMSVCATFSFPSISPTPHSFHPVGPVLTIYSPILFYILYIYCHSTSQAMARPLSSSAPTSDHVLLELSQ